MKRKTGHSSWSGCFAAACRRGSLGGDECDGPPGPVYRPAAPECLDRRGPHPSCRQIDLGSAIGVCVKLVEFIRDGDEPCRLAAASAIERRLEAPPIGTPGHELAERLLGFGQFDRRGQRFDPRTGSGPVPEGGPEARADEVTRSGRGRTGHCPGRQCEFSRCGWRLHPAVKLGPLCSASGRPEAEVRRAGSRRGRGRDRGRTPRRG